MFDIFKKNLHKASMLAYIFVVNLPSPEEEIKFIMGNQDLSKDDSLCKYVINLQIDQWNSRDRQIAGVALR